jgi:predicted permease
MRLFRPALILCAVVCVAVATPLLAQQATDSTRAAVTLSAQPSAHSTTAPAAQPTSERFGRIGASATNSHASAAAFDGEGGSHTIVISTLALVLIIIIIVLLIR